MPGPRLCVDVAAVEANARAVVADCRAHGVAVCGVTKAVAGHPAVAAAMVRGGVASLADSRLEHLARLRDAGVDLPLVLLRLPERSRVAEVVALADASVASELDVLRALGRAASRRGRRHPVLVMVDLGDLREGVWPDDLPAFVRLAAEVDGIHVAGLGTNLACFAGVHPTAATMRRFVDLVALAEDVLGRPLAVVSGGNSSALPLMAAGGLPGRVTELRLGEAILLGRETTRRCPWPGTTQDAFVLRGEVLEVRRKPSAPAGPGGQDALGRTPVFEDCGVVERALVDLGEVDCTLSALVPRDRRLRVVGGSSDYLVLDVTAAGGTVRVGDEVGFDLGYAALATAATAPGVAVEASGVPVGAD